MGEREEERGEGRREGENTSLLKLETFLPFSQEAAGKTPPLPAGLELATAPKGPQDSGLRH